MPSEKTNTTGIGRGEDGFSPRNIASILPYPQKHGALKESPPSRYPGRKSFTKPSTYPGPHAPTCHDTYAKRGLARPAPATVNIVSCESKSTAEIHRDLNLGLSLPCLVKILSLLKLMNIVNDGVSCRRPLLTRGYLQQGLTEYCW